MFSNSIASFLVVLAAAAKVAADTTLVGFAGADCTGSVINTVSYPSGAGCHCDWGDAAKSLTISGDSPVTLFVTTEPTVCDPNFALAGDETNSCSVAPAGFNIQCAFVH